MLKDEYVAKPVVSSEIGFEGRIWNVKRDVVDYNGEQLVREYVDHPGAVAIMALNERMEVLLIKQYRHPVGAYLWEIPAGLKDVDGESELDAAQRELFEETGWVATSWDDLTSFYTTPGGNTEEISVYLARDLTYRGHKLELEGEEKDLEVAWVPLQDAVEAVLKGNMKSPSAVVGTLALGLWVASGALR
jgi:8-oxo-dGTP pyrophosphatase MutT (NUDIX family)